jgi:thiol-disulfide isomerase/thioredoxin
MKYKVLTKVDMVNRVRNSLGRFTHVEPVNVTTEERIPELKSMLKNGRITFIFVNASWCGHCHTFTPTWEEFENTPGRYANVARVHYDMVEKIPEIAKAKLQGYPSVIKVKPNGTMEEFKIPGSNENTNAIPYMRENKRMKQELTLVSPNGVETKFTIGKNIDSKIPSVQNGLVQSGGAYGSVMGAFAAALQKAGPAALLLFANHALSGRSKTYRSPKRSSKQASTRKNRS